LSSVSSSALIELVIEVTSLPVGIEQILICAGEESIDALFVLAIVNPGGRFEMSIAMLAANFFAEKFDPNFEHSSAGWTWAGEISGFGHGSFSIETDRPRT
jgi:hypothetical protein